MKLLVLDVEGTLFRGGGHLHGISATSTIWPAIAEALGPAAVREEVDTHHKWERGEYGSYLDWMSATVSIHRRRRLDRDLFDSIISAAEYNAGVLETIPTVDRSTYELVLVSGGFRELAARAQRDLQIIHAFAACEYLFDDKGSIQSFNLLPCDFEGKIDFIQLMLREYHLAATDWIFVGDGPNDAPIAERAPTAIGYRPHPKLQKHVDHTIRHFAELPAVLDELDR